MAVVVSAFAGNRDMPLLELLDHEVPAHASIVFFKICENCGRNFFRCQDSSLPVRMHRAGSAYCCDCMTQLRTIENQIWRCARCGTDRSWGMGRPEETEGKQLICARCHDVTEHRFVKVA